MAFPFEQTQILLTQGCFLLCLVEMAQWFCRRRFLNFVNVFSLFGIHLHVKKGRALHLNNIIYPLNKDDLCQGWLELAQLFWRRFFQNINVFSLFRNYLPLEKGGVFHLHKLNSLIQGWFVLSLVEIAPVVLEEKIL